MSAWEKVLFGLLLVNGAVLLAYRVYRLSRGGPLPDVVGGAVLAAALAVMAGLLSADLDWIRWPALAYGLIFGLIGMPVWVLAVLIPLPPGGIDYAFTVTYWATLLGIVVAALSV